MAGLPKSLRDEYGALKIGTAGGIAACLTIVFMAVAFGQISESVTTIAPDGTIEVRNNSAVAVGITLFNAMAGAAITFIYLEHKRKGDESKTGTTPGTTG